MTTSMDSATGSRGSRIVDARVIVTCPGRNFVTLKLTTADGVTGVGDATLNGRELAVASYLQDHVCPTLIGRDSARIDDTWHYLYKGAYWRRGPVTMTAIAAVDTALWDIKGKVAGLPVRKDDDPEVFKTRLETYARDTAAVTPYYEGRRLLHVVDGDDDDVRGRRRRSQRSNGDCNVVQEAVDQLDSPAGDDRQQCGGEQRRKDDDLSIAAAEVQADLRPSTRAGV